MLVIRPLFEHKATTKHTNKGNIVQREGTQLSNVFLVAIFVRLDSTRFFPFPEKLKHEFGDIGSYSIFHQGEYRKYGRSPRSSIVFRCMAGAVVFSLAEKLAAKTSFLRASAAISQFLLRGLVFPLLTFPVILAISIDTEPWYNLPF